MKRNQTEAQQTEAYKSRRHKSADYRVRSIAGIGAAFLITCSFCTCTAFVMPEEVKADASVSKMEIQVVLDDDGRAEITQQWDAYADDGTEYYLYFKDSGYLYFDNLTVSDDAETYSNIGDWDVDADFEDKAYCCGINQVDDGVELCWGISEYGENHYTISYTVDNLVVGYNDENGFLYRFVNSGMDIFPTGVDLTIELADGTALSEENAAIWGFGYDGQIVFEDGKIHAWTENDLEDDANMTLMVRLDQELMTPGYNVDDAFQNVIDLALEDSDYIEEYTQNYGYNDYDDHDGEDHFEYDDSQWSYIHYDESEDIYWSYPLDWDGDNWGYYDENDGFVDLTSYKDELDEAAEEAGEDTYIYYYLDGSWESDDFIWEDYDEDGDEIGITLFDDDWFDPIDVIPIVFIGLIGAGFIYWIISDDKKAKEY